MEHSHMESIQAEAVDRELKNVQGAEFEVAPVRTCLRAYCEHSWAI